MAKPTRVPAQSHRETPPRSPTVASAFPPFRKPLPERTTPAIIREAPWFAFNACATPVAPAGPTFGPTRFLLGANVPWIHLGLDVGTSPWRPEGGLHAHPEDAALLRQVFERLRNDGVGFARYFVLGDGRAGVRFAEDGTPEGLDGSVFPDVEVVLEAARSTGLSLVLVVLDAGWLQPTELPDGCVVGGHADTLREVEKRTAVLERVVRPLLMRFGDHPAVLAWEVMHAPDRRTLGLPGTAEARARATGTRLGEAALRAWRKVSQRLGLTTERPERPSWVGKEQMREFLSEAVNLVHRHTQALATVGVSAPTALELVRGLGVDFYAVDWEPEASEETLRRAVSDFGLDRPLVLGAFPGRHPRRSIKSLLDTARCAGHGGAFVWSVLQHDGSAGYDGQLGQWSRNHSGHLFRREVPPPLRASDGEAGPRSDAPVALQR
jgi:hypothetical protein